MDKPHTNTKHFTLFSDYDIHLFKEGTHCRLYEKLGSHPATLNGKRGVYFAVYAPGASYVSVLGDFNHWDRTISPLFVRWDSSGIWEGWIEGIDDHTRYKYFIINADTGEEFEKIDPFARGFEHPPKTASLVRFPSVQWNDAQWMEERKKKDLNTPMSVYEVHLGSWRKKQEGDHQRSLTYTELADELVNYVKEMGYTHVEFLPITEHPFDLSWGYQSLGFFAPTSRFGSFEECAYMIDRFHQNNIGVILDFVPSHFPCDAHGLYRYDGTHVFEYPDPLKQIHPDWGSAVFNFERPFVRSFLISAALFWIEHLHIDCFRIDAVASMLYLDYSRKDGQWSPNQYGGHENLEAVEFLRILNTTLFGFHPDIHMIAEESTSWRGVSHPAHSGGLGFDMKWMMGWMHDVLHFLHRDSIYRKYHYGELIFSFLYFTHENFMLPLSHDEVTHGKGSLIDRMPGDYWQKFANLRLLFAYMFFHPGTKLSFMGNEIAQFNEWSIHRPLDWELLAYDSHRSFQRFIQRLNHLYRTEPALYVEQFSDRPLEWLINNDGEQCVIAFVRKYQEDEIVIIGNFTPEVRHHYRIGVNSPVEYEEVFNSDATEYFGSGITNPSLHTEKINAHGRSQSISLTLPPLGFLALKKKVATTKSTKK